MHRLIYFCIKFHSKYPLNQSKTIVNFEVPLLFRGNICERIGINPMTIYLQQTPPAQQRTDHPDQNKYGQIRSRLLPHLIALRLHRHRQPPPPTTTTTTATTITAVTTTITITVAARVANRTKKGYHSTRNK